MIFSSIHTKDDFKNYPAAVQRAIEYLKKYKLASSEGVNKIGNRMIRFEVLKKVLLQTDGIETDIFEKIHRRVHTIFSFRHLTHIPLMSLLITAIRNRRL